MTWPEVRDALKAGKTTVIIPTGGTEQNGPHMVLGKHNWLVRYKAGEVAKRLGDTLVAPVVVYVPEGDQPAHRPHAFPRHHHHAPGRLCQGAGVRGPQLQQHGFKQIAFLGDSGGNQAGQKLVADALNKEWAIGRRPGRSLERLLSRTRRRLAEDRRACQTRTSVRTRASTTRQACCC